MMKKTIAILGGGNLGIALAKGFTTKKAPEAYSVTVTRRNVERIRYLQDHDITVTDDNLAAVQASDFIILAVQPGQLNAVLDDINSGLNSEKHIVISAVSGVPSPKIAARIEHNVSVIRVMPNTAASINQSMTCIEKTGQHRIESAAADLFNTLGQTLLIETELMQASTVLNACGLAFFLRCIRAASQGGIEVGFHAEDAQFIAAQTAVGAAKLLQESGSAHPEQEIDKVTTPNGCTIAGLNEMEHHGLSSALIKGIKKSYTKIGDID